MLTTFFIIGLIGCFGMTWLFPVVGNFVWRAQQSPSRKSGSTPRGEISELRSIAVLIPAHNESSVISGTVESVRRAARSAENRFPTLSVTVTVCADGCSDDTVSIARRGGAEVVEQERALGKWKTICGLIRGARTSDWVVLADAGVLWPEDFLESLVAEVVGDPRVIAVAPTYRNPAAGSVENALWSVERFLKSLEGDAGGPVSIHGATIAYDRAKLEIALSQLGDESWLNDDVVLPLVMRSLFPEGRIVYASEVGVSDQPESGVVSETSSPRLFGGEFSRRRRMVLGNIQWMRSLLAHAWSFNSVAGVLALRRVFRLLWAYWGVLLGISGAAFLGQALGFPVAGFVLVLAFVGILAGFLVAPLRRILDSACASLLVPYYFITARGVNKVVWR